MPNLTKIEWSDYTSNGVTAMRKDGTGRPGWFCDKPDAKGGCPHCYAESINLRWGNGLKFDKENRGLVEFTVRRNEQRDLLKLNDKKPGSKVFIGDMFDLFQPSIPDVILKELFNVYEDCGNLELQFLTKYTARMSHFLTDRYHHGSPVPKHFIIGMSAATRHWFDKNISHLLSVHARHFISFEPLLEDLKLDRFDLIGISWAILGGESGSGARPCDLAWIRSLKDVCSEAAVPCFIKQLGTKPISNLNTDFIGKLPVNPDKPLLAKWALPLTSFKGGDITEWPADLQVREFPK